MAGRVFVLLAAYYLVQVVGRVATGQALQLDEAEQILLGQEWRWGYGSQGPLYTWLFLALQASVGSDVLALALLKNGLLLATHAWVYCAARRVTGDEGRSLVASLSILLIPHLAYESQRDQTHLVLATALAAGTVAALLRCLNDPGRLSGILLGLAGGLGVLSKYNFTVLLAGLVLAAVLHRRMRDVILGRTGVWAVAAAVLVCAPHLGWMLRHPDLLFSQAHKFGIEGAGGWEARGRGLAVFLLKLGEYLSFPALFLIAAGPARRWCAPAFRRLSALVLCRHTPAGLVAAGVGATLALTLMALLISGATEFKARWLQPVMILLPLLACHVCWRWLRPEVQLRVARFVGFAAVAALVAVQGTVWAAGWINRSHHANASFDAVATALREDGFRHGVILSDDRRIAGNLLRHFDGSAALVPQLDYIAVDPSAPVVLVWDARKGKEPPAPLVRWGSRWVERWPCHTPSGIIEVRGRRGDPRLDRLAYVVF